MNTEEAKLRAHSLLRQAGLTELPRPVLAGILIIGLVLVLVGIWQFWPRANADYIATGKPRAADIGRKRAASASTQVDIVIDVEGAVNAPGLYTLAADSRVGEAIEAAGGFAADAQPGATNLAQKLSDGEQIFIPTIEEAQGATNAASIATTPSSKQDGKININTANAEELQELSGVGPPSRDVSSTIASRRDASPQSRTSRKSRALARPASKTSRTRSAYELP